MTAVERFPEIQANFSLPVGRISEEFIRQWGIACGEFLRWERERLLEADPSEEERTEHRQALKWLLRVTALLHSATSDPEFPDRSLAAEMEGRLWQLRHSWRLFYDRLPQPEADKLIAEIFPG